MSVKVAVRLRPFSQREIELQSKLIIQMKNNTTYIENVATGDKRDYTFDYSFWSHDGYDINEEVF